MNKEFIPFVEKYRPACFEHIVLDSLNKTLFTRIIETSYFPNLLFYGPPGTGKTTTIMHLIRAYQAKQGIYTNDLVIHLNASDERGIDIIRNQISCFVNTKPLFRDGMKFVILDEVDYMTKNAQQALCYLLQNDTNQVRFCLICNYISRIEESLQHEFVRLRFNQLPKDHIIQFLRHISESERLGYSLQELANIQQLFKSDIRSMINYMQSNPQLDHAPILDHTVWEHIAQLLHSASSASSSSASSSSSSSASLSCSVAEKRLNLLYDQVCRIGVRYNLSHKQLVKDLIRHFIQTGTTTRAFLDVAENVLHSHHDNERHLLYYTLTQLVKGLK